MPMPEKANTNRFPKITEEGLDDLRQRIGVKITDTLEPWNYEATRDAIRHYAHGIGDDNPLWTDPEYAASTPHGRLIASPSFIFACMASVQFGWSGLGGFHQGTDRAPAVGLPRPDDPRPRTRLLRAPQRWDPEIMTAATDRIVAEKTDGMGSLTCSP